MVRTGRPLVSTVLVLLVFSPTVVACNSTQHVPFDSRGALDRATGVTTRSGKKISFTVSGASIVNDTLYAVGKTGQVIIPTDSIATVSKPKFSAVRTLGLVGGFVAGAFVVALIAVASSGLNIGP